MVLRRCRHLLHDEGLAADALHDVFVQLLQHQGRLEDRGLSSLLYRMATHVCLNRLRSRRRRPETPGEDLLQRIAALDDTEGRTLAAAALEHLFGQQPESTRTMAVLHLLDGLTLEEVAAEVGLSVSGVRKRLRTLRTHLHELEEV
jgi:RNA polymerase sigma factor (sigma-70 family)